jgi:hypothetical protein
MTIPDQKALHKQLERLIYAPNVNDREIIYWQAYSVKQLEISIIPEVHEQLKNQFRSFATTELQRARLEQAKKLCDLFMKHSRILLILTYNWKYLE